MPHEEKRAEAADAARRPVLDVHTHLFCWGENSRDGFMSDALRRAWTTRVLLKVTGVDREPGETRSERMRNRLLRHLNESSLDHAVVLAQDAVYRADGSRNDAATHFYVSNDCILRLAEEHPKVLPGVSINPWRSDSLVELERCRTAGARLVKIHTAIQGVDPGLKRFDSFYRQAGVLGMVLMFHTGYEHSCGVVSQAFADPMRLARPLDQGLTVIAAHAGTCAFFDPRDYYPNFVSMMQRHSNLYGDTAVLATSIRWFALKRLSRAPARLRRRMLHGSDYPLPPARLPHVLRTGLRPPQRHNPLDMDLLIKRSYAIGPDYETQAWSLLSPATR